MRPVIINRIVAARIKRVLQEEKSCLEAALYSAESWLELPPAEREETAANIRGQLDNINHDIAHLEAAMKEDEQ